MSELVYWTQPWLNPSKLYDQIGVFAGTPNCAVETCPLVKMPVAVSDAMSIFWYCPTNPFTGPELDVPRSVLTTWTGLNADGMGTNSADGPNAVSTDGPNGGTVGIALSPRALHAGGGACITVVPGVDIAHRPANPWVDRGAMVLRCGLQHPYNMIEYHDGTVSNDGVVYYYLTFTLMALGAARQFAALAPEQRHPRAALWEAQRQTGAAAKTVPRIQFVVRMHLDKFSEDHGPDLSYVPNCVFPYAGGALISATLGQGVLGEGPFYASQGHGTFTTHLELYKDFAWVITREHLAASVSYINSHLNLTYPIDYREWGITHFALDIESIGTGKTNPQIGLSFNGLTLAATEA